MPSLKKPRSDLCVVFLNCIAIEHDDVSTGALKKWGKFLKFYDTMRNALRWPLACEGDKITDNYVLNNPFYNPFYIAFLLELHFYYFSF